MALLDFPDEVYNWMVEYFSGHTHCTKYGEVTSAKRAITASIVQGSSIGPASYTSLLLPTSRLSILVT